MTNLCKHPLNFESTLFLFSLNFEVIKQTHKKKTLNIKKFSGFEGVNSLLQFFH